MFLLFRLSRMFGIFAGLGEVGVRILQHRVLIPVPELTLHGSIALLVRLILLHSPFAEVLIFMRILGISAAQFGHVLVPPVGALEPCSHACSLLPNFASRKGDGDVYVEKKAALMKFAALFIALVLGLGSLSWAQVPTDSSATGTPARKLAQRHHAHGAERHAAHAAPRHKPHSAERHASHPTDRHHKAQRGG
jgi:hypothetical protein